MAENTAYFLEVREKLTKEQYENDSKEQRVKKLYADRDQVLSDYTKTQKEALTMTKYRSYVHHCNHAVDGSGQNRPCKLELIEEVG